MLLHRHAGHTITSDGRRVDFIYTFPQRAGMPGQLVLLTVAENGAGQQQAIMARCTVTRKLPTADLVDFSDEIAAKAATWERGGVIAGDFVPVRQIKPGNQP